MTFQKGMLTFNLSDTRFVELVSTLAANGVSWRLGGTPQDYLLYEEENGHWPAEDCWDGHVGGPIPNRNICLSRARVRALCSFAASMKSIGPFKWFFGLNALFGRNSSTSPMDMSNLKSFVEYVERIGCKIDVFELGNENNFKNPPPNHFIDPRAWAGDFARLQSLVQEKFEACKDKFLRFFVVIFC